MRVAYVHGRVGAWWPEQIRANGFVIAAREVHVLYESEGLPGEQFVGGMKYVGREGKAAVLEQRIVEATTGRPIARAWVVQLLVQRGRSSNGRRATSSGSPRSKARRLPPRPRRDARPWGPGLDESVMTSGEARAERERRRSSSAATARGTATS